MNAVLVLPANAPRADWLAARHNGIGASDIAAVMGISPWQSPFSLFHQKVNRWEEEGNDYTDAGRRLEPVIADWFADVADPIENLIMRPAGLYRSADRPWQMATPDRLVRLPCDECDGDGIEDHWAPEPEPCQYCGGDGGRPGPVAVLECKHPYDWEGFGEPNTDDIPVAYRAQVLWQCDVMDVPEWFLAAYSRHEFRIYRGKVDGRAEADIRVMRAAGQRFWHNIVGGNAPDLDGHRATIATLKRLHPFIEDRDVEVPVEFAEGYRRARALARRGEQLVDRYEARARSLLGNARRLMCGKKLVVSRSIYEQAGDSAELTALEGDWPVVDRLNPGRAASYL